MVMSATSFSDVSLMAMVPESEWRMPTLMVSSARAGRTARNVTSIVARQASFFVIWAAPRALRRFFPRARTASGGPGLPRRTRSRRSIAPGRGQDEFVRIHPAGNENVAIGRGAQGTSRRAPGHAALPGIPRSYELVVPGPARDGFVGAAAARTAF